MAGLPLGTADRFKIKECRIIKVPPHKKLPILLSPDLFFIAHYINFDIALRAMSLST